MPPTASYRRKERMRGTTSGLKTSKRKRSNPLQLAFCGEVERVAEFESNLTSRQFRPCAGWEFERRTWPCHVPGTSPDSKSSSTSTLPGSRDRIEDDSAMTATRRESRQAVAILSVFLIGRRI